MDLSTNQVSPRASRVAEATGQMTKTSVKRSVSPNARHLMKATTPGLHFGRQLARRFRRILIMARGPDRGLLERRGTFVPRPGVDGNPESSISWRRSSETRHEGHVIDSRGDRKYAARGANANHALSGRILLKLDYLSPGFSKKDRAGAGNHRGGGTLRSPACRPNRGGVDQRQHGNRSRHRLRNQRLSLCCGDVAR